MNFSSMLVSIKIWKVFWLIQVYKNCTVFHVYDFCLSIKKQNNEKKITVRGDIGWKEKWPNNEYFLKLFQELFWPQLYLQT